MTGRRRTDMEETKKTSAFSNRKRSELIVNIFALVLIILTAFAVLLPIYWIFRSSGISYGGFYAYPPRFIPEEWLWSNYSRTLETFTYWIYLKNTFSIIIPAVLAGTITCIFSAYPFSRLHFKGKKFIFTLCVGTILLPGMVTLIPLYIFWTRGCGLVNTYWPLILPFLTGGGFFNIFLLKQFMDTVPKDLDEAAEIDGASKIHILWSILVPSIKPAITVVVMLLFIQIWNDLLQQIIYINTMDKYTFAMGLTTFTGAFGTKWNYTMAATCLTIAPGIIVYLFGQKSFVEGIVLTGMKN